MKPKLLKDIKKELDDYPAGYDAHKDRLADNWDHEESVNKLLTLLRRVVEDEA